MISLEQMWALARSWYEDDRRAPGWRRKTLEEAVAIFAAIGLSSGFWSLSP